MSIMAGPPVSISFQPNSDWFHSPSPSSTAFPSRTGHYRPFSTLNSQSPYIETARESPLGLRRSASVGGLQQLCHNMGIQFSPKGKKEQIRATSPATLLPRRSSSRRVAKKRSLTPIFLTSDRSDFTTPNATPSSQSQPRDSDDKVDLSPKGVSFEETEVFMPKDIWAKRQNMKLHPYHKQVPYMQAYDPISLQSDRYTGLLLQRLSKGSPSFHHYGKTPPATALDLGCGPGYWILHAANVWRSTKFTAFDLVDITLPALETNESINFVQGDFINYKLPFPDNTFDFVRMANLVLCIPYDKWEFVLGQVLRVLTPGGRLELIDDQIYFPYGEVPKDLSSPSTFDLKTNLGDHLPSQVGRKRRVDDGHGDEGSADTDAALLIEQSHFDNFTAPSSPELFEGPEGVLPSELKYHRLVRPRTPHYILRRGISSLRSTPPEDGKSTTRSKDPLVVAMSTLVATTPTCHHRSGSNPDNGPPRPQGGVPSPPEIMSSGSAPPSPEFRKVLRDKVAPRSLPFSASKAWGRKTSDASVKAMLPIFSSRTSKSMTDPKGVVWQRKACAARNLEKVFEKMLTEEYQIHLQPAEFLVEILKRVFCTEAANEERAEKGRVRKLKSFHIKLAPLDTATTESFDERGRGKESGRSSSPGNTESVSTGVMLGDRESEEDKEIESPPSTSNWEKKKGKKEDQNRKRFKILGASAATTRAMTLSLTDSPPKSLLKDNISSTPPIRTLSAKAAVRLGISYSELSEAVISESLTTLRTRLKATTFRFSSTSTNSSMLSAKAADCLGISYSELSAAATFSAPRTAPRPPGSRLVSSPIQVPSAVPFPIRSDSPCKTSTIFSARPLQHTGLLIWPKTYIPMAAGELEMHACKYIHTLLGCQPALEDFVAKYVDDGGVRWVGEEEFKEEVWEYECFRRARFNWPLEASDPFEDDPMDSNAYATTTSPTVISTPTASAIPTSSNLELPIISLTQSTSATGSLHTNSSDKRHVADVFEGNKAKVLRPTKSNILLRPSSPLEKPPQRRYDAMKAMVKAKSKTTTPQSTSDLETESDNRSGSVTPTPLHSRSSTPTHSSCSNGSSTEKLAEAVTESFAKYRREEAVHLRTIRVFEAVKEG